MSEGLEVGGGEGQREALGRWDGGKKVVWKKLLAVGDVHSMCRRCGSCESCVCLLFLYKSDKKNSCQIWLF